jgi:hypothetical protein
VHLGLHESRALIATQHTKELFAAKKTIDAGKHLLYDVYAPNVQVLLFFHRKCCIDIFVFIETLLDFIPAQSHANVGWPRVVFF